VKGLWISPTLAAGEDVPRHRNKTVVGGNHATSVCQARAGRHISTRWVRDPIHKQCQGLQPSSVRSIKFTNHDLGRNTYARVLAEATAVRNFGIGATFRASSVRFATDSPCLREEPEAARGGRDPHNATPKSNAPGNHGACGEDCRPVSSTGELRIGSQGRPGNPSGVWSGAARNGVFPVKSSQIAVDRMAKSTGKVTSKSAASAASKVLRNPKASRPAKSAAGSALSQREKLPKKT
jgi:hypothetical protein